jgi:hypothetical protein
LSSPPPLFSRLGHTHLVSRSSWNGTKVSHRRFHDTRRMNKSADVSKFKISPLPWLNVEFCLTRCFGAWTITCTWHFRPWTGSIKPSRQHFQFVLLGFLYGFYISLYVFFSFFPLLSHQYYLSGVEVVEILRLYLIKYFIFSILK